MSNIKKRGSLWRSKLADIKRGCNGTELMIGCAKECRTETKECQTRVGVDKRGMAADGRDM